LNGHRSLLGFASKSNVNRQILGKLNLYEHRLYTRQGFSSEGLAGTHIIFGDLPKKVKTSARRSNFRFPRADQFGESINHDTLTKAAVRASTARK